MQHEFRRTLWWIPRAGRAEGIVFFLAEGTPAILSWKWAVRGRVEGGGDGWLVDLLLFV